MPWFVLRQPLMTRALAAPLAFLMMAIALSGNIAQAQTRRQACAEASFTASRAPHEIARVRTGLVYRVHNSHDKAAIYVSRTIGGVPLSDVEIRPGTSVDISTGEPNQSGEAIVTVRTNTNSTRAIMGSFTLVPQCPPIESCPCPPSRATTPGR